MTFINSCNMHEITGSTDYHHHSIEKGHAGQQVKIAEKMVWTAF